MCRATAVRVVNADNSPLQPDTNAGVLRRLTVRRVRLATGIVLFTYLSTHFLNHSLGLVSLQAMEDGRALFLALWRNPVGTTALYGSLLIHFVLALYALYARRRLRMNGAEAVQYVLGLCVPFLLATHAMATRGLHEVYGIEDRYAYVLLALWVYTPERGVLQVVLFLAAWIHGCIGLHMFLRLRRGYRTALPYLYAGALLIPTLGLLGFLAGGQRVARLSDNERWLNAAFDSFRLPPAEVGEAFVYGGTWWISGGFIALMLGALALRPVRVLMERRRGIVRISYPDGRMIRIGAGPSILDVSRAYGIPHASVCGGRGRCSTCRVRVGKGLEMLPDPSEVETEVLRRVGAPPNVRLACQTHPAADIEIFPLLPPTAGPEDAHPRPTHLQGRERELIIMFADLRAFTQFAEHKLPYDVVFVLNRYFNAMGSAIESTGGHVDKFIGDGVMALFGIDDGAKAGARQALSAARRMSEELDKLNRSLAGDLTEPLRIGIGIHAGHVIVGEMGYAHATSITAIGDAVNTASRLESLTKEFGMQLAVSDAVAEHATIDLSSLPAHDVEIRGRSERLRVRMIADARDLAGLDQAGRKE